MYRFVSVCRLAGAFFACGVWFASSVEAADPFEQALLEKFKKQNETTADSLRKKVEDALKRAEQLEVPHPAKALDVIRAVREELILDSVLTWDAKAEAFALLRTKVDKLHGVVKDKEIQRARDSHSEFQLARQQTAFQFRAIQTQEQVGVPARFVFADGAQSYGSLHADPEPTVTCSFGSLTYLYPAGDIIGIQVQEGFHVFDERMGIYRFLTNEQFFVLVYCTQASAARASNWGYDSVDTPPPPPGFNRSRPLNPTAMQSLIRAGETLMSEGLVNWTDRRRGVLANLAAVGGRPARDSLIDVQLSDFFPNLRPATKDYLKDLLIAYLDQDRADGPLADETLDSIVDRVVRIDPDVRLQAQALTHYLYRLVQARQDRTSRR